MSLLVHLSLCPWKRITARSAVAATTGGIDDVYPCGMSTHTYGTAHDVRESSVSVTLSSDIQVLLRNSTQIGTGSARRLHSSTYSLLRRPMGNHCGNWNSSAPSLPAWCSGSSAARNRSQTWSTTFWSRSFAYTLAFASSGRRSLQSEAVRVGCWVSNE